MYIAVEGCGHGELDGIYAGIQHVEKARSIKVDLLIICGDFQATRNPDDLQCMAVPPKYYTMGTFYKYYSGELRAPVLTLVVGGNHEASNYMQALAHGGWLAPNIYFVGYASVLRFGSLRIGALSGIYNGHDYLKGHHERPPYDRSTMRSAYHVRNVDTYRLKQLTPDMDIFISHDWPRGVYHHGDVNQLLSKKPFFREEVESNKLGSRPAEELLHRLQPRFWFSAHLHVKFSALVEHGRQVGDPPPAAAGPDAAAPPATGGGRTTRFLALDKCLPRRRYMQILELGDGAPELSYDLEWLTVLRLTDHLTSVSSGTQYMPGPGCGQRFDFRPSAEELAETRAIWGEQLRVPADFAVTAPPYDGRSDIRAGRQPAAATDPQTSRFCRRLRVRDPMEMLCGSAPPPVAGPMPPPPADPAQADITLDGDLTLDPDGPAADPAEIGIDDDDVGEDDMFVIDRKGTSTPRAPPADFLSLNPARGRPAVPISFPEIAGKVTATPAKDSPDLMPAKDSPDLTPAKDSPAVTPAKKFKRRNQAIYGADADG
ncbi:lariat debranching enzyme A-like [Amphibalanus amphitrite]|uniref:lariat debranching enzyme A-like n=1 Tax=Amphibalanus amphitrite TaxID=1232801 RepID=UPI001C92B952|nr:lariat debranching enzyme A-like [Amphibalanus amphitrite]XP_043239529.1 lariat debranching enzyme A-like [Amphibalanus amphitrite]